MPCHKLPDCQQFYQEIVWISWGEGGGGVCAEGGWLNTWVLFLIHYAFVNYIKTWEFKVYLKMCLYLLILLIHVDTECNKHVARHQDESLSLFRWPSASRAIIKSMYISSYIIVYSLLLWVSWVLLGWGTEDRRPTDEGFGCRDLIKSHRVTLVHLAVAKKHRSKYCEQGIWYRMEILFSRNLEDSRKPSSPECIPFLQVPVVSCGTLQVIDE